MSQDLISFFYYCWDIILVISVIVGVVSVLYSSKFSKGWFSFIIVIISLLIICSGVVGFNYREVPLVTNLSLDSAIQSLYNNDLGYLYNSDNMDISKLIVINQDPANGTIVQKGTLIYLETSSTEPAYNAEPNDSSPDEDTSSDDNIVNSEQESHPSVVDLSTQEPYYTKSYELYVSELITDTLGNVYSTGLESWWCNSEPQSNTYYINQEYSLLTAVVVVNEVSKGSKEVASIDIYGDDECLYHIDITSDMKPIEIAIDISSVTDLRIDMKGRGNIGFNSMNATLCNILLHR